ncbi:MAG: hypothetical protein ACFCAD_12685, partial [Pleurocapsa sp.]
MLLRQNNPKVVKSILFTGLLALLASCGNSSALESMVRADPQLRKGTVESKVKTPNNNASNSTKINNNAPATNTPQADSKRIREDGNIVSSNVPNEQALLEDDAQNPVPQDEIAPTGLPANFPASFPIYPKVNLKEAKVGEDKASGMLTWTSSDNSKAIADYYQAELTSNQWEIIKPFNFDDKAEIARAIAVKDNHKVHLTLLRSQNKETGNNGTKLSAIYEPVKDDVALSNSDTENRELDPTLESSEQDSRVNATQNKSENTNEEVELFPEIVRKKQNNLAKATTENRDYIARSSDFSDLDNIPEPLVQPLDTVAALGILSPYTQEGIVEVSKFAPN